jgi:predicted TIM-barrel fold metal-dependent hydrolase
MELPMTYQLMDADEHYYEPPDFITRYMAASQQDIAFREVEREGKRTYLAGDRLYTFLTDPFLYGGTARPGALKQMLRNLAAGRRELEPADPGSVDKEARLATLDEQGVEKTLMLPTVGVTIEHFFGGNPDLIYPNLHAFNQWLLDDWGFGADRRLYGVPLISLADPERAVTELDWLLENGARIVALRPGAAYGRSPADPMFDGFWGRVNEARVPVAFHISESGYNERYSVEWGEDPNAASHSQSALQWTLFFGDRPIMDTMAALVLHNLFGRFPDVRILSLENGSLWVPYLLKQMDKMYKMGAAGPWLGGRLTERPSGFFERHVFVSPYHEENVVALCELIGPSQVLFGSDWPHPEGVARADEWFEVVSPLTLEAQRLVMRENLAALLEPA